MMQVEEEIAEIIEWCTVQSQSIDPKKAIKMKERRPNIRLLGLNPYQYFIRVLKQIKAPDMEQALLVLPFHYVSRLISLLLKVRLAWSEPYSDDAIDNSFPSIHCI